MAKLLRCLVLASVAVTLIIAGAFQFPWEKDQEIRENSFQQQGEPAVNKHENHKDFIGSMMRRIFGKSENPNQSHLRLARAAAAEAMVAAKSTTRRATTSTQRTTTVKTTRKTTLKTTVKTTVKTTPKTTPKTTLKTTPKTTLKTTPKTTLKTTAKTTTTPKPTQRTTNRVTTKHTTRRPGSGASALETSTLATVVLAFSAVCLQWVLHR